MKNLHSQFSARLLGKRKLEFNGHKKWTEQRIDMLSTAGSVYLSVCLSASLSAWMSDRLTAIRMPACQIVRPSVCSSCQRMFIHFFVCLSSCLSTGSVFLPDCLSVCTPISPSFFLIISRVIWPGMKYGRLFMKMRYFHQKSHNTNTQQQITVESG